MKVSLQKSITDEKGQALVIVLILMLVGGLIIAPLLSYMSTGLKVGKEVYESKMYQFYAADAGIEDALWRLNNAEEVPLDDGYVYDLDPQLDPYAYGTPWPSTTHPLNINDKSVAYTITPIWPLEGLESATPFPPPTTPTAMGFIREIDRDNDEATYQVDLTYDGSLGDLTVDAVKVWLPVGFKYKGPTSGITEDDPTPIDKRAGKALIWYFGGVNFEDLTRPEPQPGEFFPADEFPMKRTLTFKISPAGNPRGAISWLEGTTTIDGYCLAWDTTCEVYKILSTAEDITIESYTSKENIKKKGAVTAISGDYIAIGNSLMKHTHIPRWWEWWQRPWDWYCNRYGIRQTPNDPSSANVPDDVPDDAELFRAYLYWSGWKDEEYQEDWQGILDPLVHTATFNETEVVEADRVQIIENTYGWSYSCRKDVTSLMPESWVGATYTVGDVNADLGDSGDWEKDQWAYAGWSLVILYVDPSPEAEPRNIFLYDNFLYADERVGADTHVFTIKGFKAPDDSEGTLTCFVGEGDDCWDGDTISFNGNPLPYDGDPYDPLEVNQQNDVWNGMSSGLGGEFIDGVDIDTFDVSPYIDEGDTEAEIRLQTQTGIWNLVYIILSLRSDVYGPMGENTVGSITYTYAYGGG